jgi:hypothetical protein
LVALLAIERIGTRSSTVTIATVLPLSFDASIGGPGGLNSSG